jgi:hypothetical protein
MITRLRAQQQAAMGRRAAIIEAAQRDGREDMTEAENEEFRELTAEIAEFDARIVSSNGRNAAAVPSPTRSGA